MPFWGLWAPFWPHFLGFYLSNTPKCIVDMVLSTRPVPWYIWLPFGSSLGEEMGQKGIFSAKKAILGSFLANFSSFEHLWTAIKSCFLSKIFSLGSKWITEGAAFVGHSLLWHHYRASKLANLPILAIFDQLLRLWGSFLRNFHKIKNAHDALGDAPIHIEVP